MDLPRYTVIVPIPRFRVDEPVLVSLRETAPASEIQILVAEGRHPARQRNDALLRAQGEIIIFLDGDCSVGPDFWKELERVFARPRWKSWVAPRCCARKPPCRRGFFTPC